MEEYNVIKAAIIKAVEECTGAMNESDLCVSYEITKFRRFETIELNFKNYDSNEKVESRGFTFEITDKEDIHVSNYCNLANDEYYINDTTVQEAIDLVKKLFEKKGVEFKVETV